MQFLRSFDRSSKGGFKQLEGGGVRRRLLGDGCPAEVDNF